MDNGIIQHKATADDDNNNKTKFMYMFVYPFENCYNLKVRRKGESAAKQLNLFESVCVREQKIIRHTHTPTRLYKLNPIKSIPYILSYYYCYYYVV